MSIWLILGGVAGFLLVWFLIEKARRKTHPVKGGLHAEITLPHKDEFELYGNAFSHCSRKTRLVFAELGLPYTHKPVDLIETGRYENISPSYLKINPAGLLPALVHRGHPVYESDDILAYAASQAAPGAPNLVPGDPDLRARMQHWIDFCSLSSADPMGDLDKRAGACVPGLTLPLFASMMRYIPAHRLIDGLLFHPDKGRPVFFLAAKFAGVKGLMNMKPPRQIMTASRDAMARHLKTLDEALVTNGGPWILGDKFTLADITLASLLLRIDETGWLAGFASGGRLPNVTAYFDRLKARPSWQSAIAQHEHGAVKRGVTDLKDLVARDAALRAFWSGS
jgi:glutathione S-transferase